MSHLHQTQRSDNKCVVLLFTCPIIHYKLNVRPYNWLAADGLQPHHLKTNSQSHLISSSFTNLYINFNSEKMI